MSPSSQNSPPQHPLTIKFFSFVPKPLSLDNKMTTQPAISICQNNKNNWCSCLASFKTGQAGSLIFNRWLSSPLQHQRSRFNQLPTSRIILSGHQNPHETLTRRRGDRGPCITILHAIPYIKPWFSP
ncbi:hypothetical protein Peur_024613 [Populus x canadensis]